MGHRAPRVWVAGVVLLAGVFLPACEDEIVPVCVQNDTTDPAQLDDAFPVDISAIEVVYDFMPRERLIEASATVRFILRPGQDRARIHFDPVFGSAHFDTYFGRTDAAVTGISLNGEALVFENPADVAVTDVAGSTQRALELQRDLDPGAVHSLEMTYRFALIDSQQHMASVVNDLVGEGNEVWFPTINSPRELARHVLTFRVHDDRPYAFIGSGRVDSSVAEGVQQWVLDTEQEVSSYTVMFVLSPADRVDLHEREVQGVAVRLMALRGNGDVPEAFEVLSVILAYLQADIGPFPMARGLSVFLLVSSHEHVGFGYGSWGMEYFGGTISTLGVLAHEIVHMYFGCSLIATTYRDSWWDEAANEWYLGKAPGIMGNGYYSDMVGGRSPVAVGFDRRAYDEGSAMFEAMAREIGGREEMLGFFGYLYEHHLFSPFDTLELLAIFEGYSGVDMTEQFLRWLYSVPC